MAYEFWMLLSLMSSSSKLKLDKSGKKGGINFFSSIFFLLTRPIQGCINISLIP